MMRGDRYSSRKLEEAAKARVVVLLVMSGRARNINRGWSQGH